MRRASAEGEQLLNCVFLPPFFLSRGRENREKGQTNMHFVVVSIGEVWLPWTGRYDDKYVSHVNNSVLTSDS